MRKPAFITLSILLALGVGILVWHFLFPRRFNGKTERQWIRSLDPPSSPATVATWKQNRADWKNLGSNAVPILLDALQMKEGPVEKVYSHLWKKFPTAHKRFPEPLSYWRMHEQAVMMLGDAGRNYNIPIEPLLIILEDDNWIVRMDVLTILNNFAPKSQPADKDKIFLAILRATKNTYPEVRMSAVYALHNFPEHASAIFPILKKLLGDSEPDIRIGAATVFYRLDPIAAEKAGAVVVAADCMKNKGVPGARYRAADLLEEMAKTSDAAIMALSDGLISTDSSLRWLAASHLGRIGPRARTAVPILSKLSREDQFEDIRNTAQDAVKRIAPEEAATLKAQPIQK